MNCRILMSACVIAFVALFVRPTYAGDAAWEQVLAAHEAKDAEALAKYAADRRFDPWIVADDLCARGHHDAAEAYAGAGTGKDVEKLPAYIVSRRDAEDDAKVRSAYAAADAALRLRDAKAALEAIGECDVSGATVPSMRLAFAKAYALRAARRFEDAGELASDAADTAEEMGWLRYAGKLHALRGGIARNAGNALFAIPGYSDHVRIQELRGDETALAEALNDLANMEMAVGMFGPAMENQTRALELNEKLGRTAPAAGNRINIGGLYLRTGDPETALAYFEQGLKEAEAAGHHDFVANAIGNIALIHRTAGRFAEARKATERALAVHRKAGNAREVAGLTGNLGMILNDLGDTEASRTQLASAISQYVEIGDEGGEATVRGALGLFLLEDGEPEAALVELERALEIRKRGKLLNAAAPLYKPLADAYLATGDKRKAREFYEQAQLWIPIIGGSPEDLKAVEAALAGLPPEEDAGESEE